MPQPIDPHAFAASWSATYPDCPPIAHRLRDVYRSRWVRFHSLPRSKRYPETEAEYAIVLERHHTVLGELVEPGESLVLVSTGYSGSAAPVRDDETLERLDAQAACWRTIRDEGLPPDEPPSYRHLFGSAWNWSPGVFDEILRAVADDEIREILIVDTARGWAYHPYDGGADVILPTTEDRDALKSRYRSWLSRRSDGL